jgi:hypothetical protein
MPEIRMFFNPYREKLSITTVLKGHGFSRAENSDGRIRASAPEGATACHDTNLIGLDPTTFVYT